MTRICTWALALMTWIQAAGATEINDYLKQRDAYQLADQLLVIIQGSDCNSVTRIEAIERDLIKIMPTADVLTVEKYGIDATLPYSDNPERTDCPAAYLQHDSLTQRAQDLETAIAKLVRQHPYRQVVAVGGSEGAVVAHLLASRSKHITATIAFNGGGQWFLDDILHSIACCTPISPREKARSMQSMRSFARYIRTAPPENQMELKASGHGYRWWRESFDTDQLALVQKSTVPTLIIQSGADESVSPDAVLAMVAKLHQANRPHLYYKTYPTLNHRLNGPGGQSQMPKVVADMAAWLRRVGITP